MTERIPTIDSEGEIPKQYLNVIKNFNLNPKEAEYYLGLVRDLLKLIGDKTKEELIHPDNIEMYTQVTEKTQELLRFVQEKQITLAEIPIPTDITSHSVHEIGDHLYLRSKNTETESFFDETGNDMGSEYQHVKGPVNADEKLLLIAQNKDRKWVLVDETGTVLSKEYNFIGAELSIKEKTYFTVLTTDKKATVIDETGTQVTGEYGSISAITDVEGELYLTVRDSAIDNRIVDIKGKIVGERQLVFGPPVRVGDKIFVGVDTGSGWAVMNDEGKTFGEYAHVDDLINVAGKLFYKAQTIDGGRRTGIILDEAGDPVSEKYKHILKIFNIGGKAYFPCQNEDDSWKMMDETGNSTGGAYSYIGHPRDIGGKIFFDAITEDDKRVIVNSEGVSVGGEFLSVMVPLDVNGKMFFSAEKNEDYSVVIDEDGKVVLEEMIAFVPPLELNGTVYFIVFKKNGNSVVMNDNGEECSPEFGKVHKFTHKDGKTIIISEDGGKVIKQEIFL